MDTATKQMYESKQQELMAKIAELEAATKLENDEAKSNILAVEKQCLALEAEMKEMESKAQEELRDQIIERKAMAAKQMKQIELSDKLIGELKKENTKLRKQQAKVVEKFKTIDGKLQKIEDMNMSLSNLHDSMSNLHELVEGKFTSLADEREHVKQENQEIKELVRKQQDLYWEVAQARLEYQKGMAKVLTMVQDQGSSAKDGEKYGKMIEELTKIALETENEAKIEFASLEIETAASEYNSPTSFTQVEEFNGNDSEQYLQISLVPQKPN